MKLLNVGVVLDIDKGIQRAGFETEVLKYFDNKTTKYAILSHRWGTEVSYKEMTRFTKMSVQNREEVKKHDGYRKIVKSCEQAKKDGFR